MMFSAHHTEDRRCYVESPRVSKEDIARRIMERDEIERGLICVLSCVEPCQTFAIRKDRATKHIELVPAKRKCSSPYVYLVDRKFGFMHIRLQSWLPFTIQVCLNGREYLARRVNPWLDPKCGLDLHGYYWSVREGEYATDVMFKDEDRDHDQQPPAVQGSPAGDPSGSAHHGVDSDA